MTKLILIAIGCYLTYYTFVYAKLAWKMGNKTAGAMIMLLAACFPTLVLLFVRI